MAAYSLSRKDMYGRNVITFFMVFTMWFSGGIVPTFLIVNKLNLVDKPIVMVIVGAINMFNTIICRTYIQSAIPIELQEALSRTDAVISALHFASSFLSLKTDYSDIGSVLWPHALE